MKLQLTTGARDLLLRTLADGMAFADSDHVEPDALDGHARDCAELLRICTVGQDVARPQERMGDGSNARIPDTGGGE